MFDKLKVGELKQIIRDYNLRVKIRGYSKMTKDQLVEEIEKHLMMNADGKIKLKGKDEIEIDIKLTKNNKQITEKDLIKMIASLRGEKIKREREIKSKDKSEKENAEKRIPEIISELKTLAQNLIKMRSGEKPKEEKKEKKEKKEKVIEEKKPEDMNETELMKKISSLRSMMNKKNTNEELESIKSQLKKYAILLIKIRGENKKEEPKKGSEKMKKDIEKVKNLKSKRKSMMEKVAETDKIIMSKKELLKEHEKLIPLLKSGTKKARVKEAMDQSKEMVKYEPKKNKPKKEEPVTMKENTKFNSNDFKLVVRDESLTRAQSGENEYSYDSYKFNAIFIMGAKTKSTTEEEDEDKDYEYTIKSYVFNKDSKSPDDYDSIMIADINADESKGFITISTDKKKTNYSLENLIMLLNYIFDKVDVIQDITLDFNMDPNNISIINKLINKKKPKMKKSKTDLNWYS